jgi:hypothetical protein
MRLDAMGLPAPGSDERVTDKQCGGAEAVEQGIQGGQKGEAGAGGVRSGMDVNEPEKKGRSRGADEQDGGDGGAGAGWCGHSWPISLGILSENLAMNEK